MKTRPAAEILREYGPFPAPTASAASRFDGQQRLVRLGRQAERSRSGERATSLRTIDVPAHAGTAFDGRHLFQIAEKQHPEDRSQDRPVRRHDPGPRRRRRLRASPGPKARCGSASIGRARSTRSIPRPARSCARIESNRFVTGVTWVDGEIWHGTWRTTKANCATSTHRPARSWQRLAMPAGTGRVRTRVRRRRPLLLRRRRQQDRARRPETEALNSSPIHMGRWRGNPRRRGQRQQIRSGFCPSAPLCAGHLPI